MWPWEGSYYRSIAFLALWLLAGLGHWGEPKRGQNGVGSPGYFSRTGVVALLEPTVAGPVKQSYPVSSGTFWLLPSALQAIMMKLWNDCHN